jgi:hypothetical protein
MRIVGRMQGLSTWAGVFGCALVVMGCGGGVVVDVPGGAGGTGVSTSGSMTTGNSGQGGGGVGSGPASVSAVSVTAGASSSSSSSGGAMCDEGNMNCGGCMMCAVGYTCATEWSQCEAQTSVCPDILSCIVGCDGDPACYAECSQLFPDDVFKALSVCMLCQACPVNCNGAALGC